MEFQTTSHLTKKLIWIVKIHLEPLRLLTMTRRAVEETKAVAPPFIMVAIST